MRITLSDIQNAKLELHKYIVPTPLLYNSWLSTALGCQIYLKLENMQPIGSFKIRGATYRISKLSAEEKKRGVIAASAGNHAQGVAWGARALGTSSLIVMPSNAAIVKVQNTMALGSEIVLKGANYDEAYQEALEIQKKTQRVFIHAFEDEVVVAGQGTVGLEILEQLPDVDFIVTSVGGGGLLAGIMTVLKEVRPQTKLIGCQALGANSMIQSVRQGKTVQLKSPRTFADGIAISKPSEKMRELLVKGVDEWIEVEEAAIAHAVLTLLEKGKILAEGSGAITLAALSSIRDQIQGKKVVLVVSGGNIDVNVLSRIIDLGLIGSGRRLRINVVIDDRPGSLANLTYLISQQGANILQSIHDRNEPSSQLDQTEVALTLETKGPEHSAKLIEILKENVIRLELTH